MVHQDLHLVSALFLEDLLSFLRLSLILLLLVEVDRLRVLPRVDDFVDEGLVLLEFRTDRFGGNSGTAVTLRHRHRRGRSSLLQAGHLDAGLRLLIHSRCRSVV